MTLRPDTEVVLHGQADGTYPGDDIGYACTYGIHSNQWVAAERAAERDGFVALLRHRRCHRPPIDVQLISTIDPHGAAQAIPVPFG